ncbi:nucleoside triphosphate pyrophosphohydrolase MazG (plasmid) [Legionella adelaidensis]|uniref:Nucleoside triphosphate pyrophosphohydrolase MazG n=1 Tax=Legionella adelaidensis TaxID=45056 RepID=A0A0W0R1G9_9GAMM|nr:MazG nucleotide pyrophosphohydrolase domain-containing protein [Legionella adelaidensis]KTC64874.1 nucleoside triphosphate pyrophosphohydrolase MazG [Legionella adelaidensis]VEH82955.1 nucleoside triphosphate pyrophosphohydrolase MazG [Legionella adelaidensis]
MNILKRMELLEADADDFGFSWENTDQIIAQIKSEINEIIEHLQVESCQNPKGLQEEIGDLFHAVISLCVFCKLDPEETLKLTTNKFERRLNAVKDLAQKDGLASLKNHSFKDLMKYWDKAKKEVS